MVEDLRRICISINLIFFCDHNYQAIYYRWSYARAPRVARTTNNLVAVDTIDLVPLAYFKVKLCKSVPKLLVGPKKEGRVYCAISSPSSSSSSLPATAERRPPSSESLATLGQHQKQSEQPWKENCKQARKCNL